MATKKTAAKKKAAPKKTAKKKAAPKKTTAKKKATPKKKTAKKKTAPKKKTTKKKAAAKKAWQTAAALAHTSLSHYAFLADIKGDSYFPPGTWERGVDILVRLALAFERDRPTDEAGVFALTHAATEEFNAMLDDNIDLETVARENIARDIGAILQASGHLSIDIEAAIAPRDW